MSLPPVLLFRSPAPSGEPDNFADAFAALSYHSVSVPVLEHALVNVDALKSVIGLGPETRYAGVIMTSGRASEAWRGAADSTSIPELQSELGLSQGLECSAAINAVGRLTRQLGTNPFLRRWSQNGRPAT